MLDDVKLALRNSSDTFDDGEIEPMIDAAKLDMQLAGVGIVDEDDALTHQAIIFYCKANFGYPDEKDAIRNQRRYESTRNTMAQSSMYQEQDGGGGA